MAPPRRAHRLDRWAGVLTAQVSTRLAILGVVVFLVFTATVLPWQAEVGSAYTDSFPAPDGSFWYSLDDLYAAAEAWGESGRSAYVFARLTFDVVWPLVYGFFLTTSLAWLFARAIAAGSRWRRLALLPALVVLLDYAENLCTASVMARFPDRTPLLAQMAPVLTASKWVLLAGCFGLLFIGGVAALITWIRSCRRTADD